jgi:hypothetical protein
MPDITVSDDVDLMLKSDDKEEIRPSILAVGSVTAGVAGANAVTNIISLTQSQYDAIDTPDANTFYVITDA